MNGATTDGKSLWDFGDDAIAARLPAPFFVMWDEWKKGNLPRAGGLYRQRLKDIVVIRAVDLVHETYRCKNTEGYPWGSFTTTQKELIQYVETAESATDSQ